MHAAQDRRTGLRPWLGLGLLVVPSLMIAIDMTVLFLSIPKITADLAASGTQQLWVLHGGELIGAGLVLTAGRVVDRFGARRMLALGLALYAAASLAAALATSVEMLIAARMLLGGAGVSVMPAAMVLVRRMFPDERHFATAVAILMSAFSAGMALGPLVGGALLERFWWGAVFLVNVPVAALVLLGVRYLPHVAGTGTGRIDLTSVALSLAGLAGVIYGGQELAAQGFGAWPNAVVAVVGLALLAAFVRRQRHLAEPLLDLRLFAAAPFTLSLLAIWLVIAADAGAELQLAQHLQVVTGLSPLWAGLALAVPAVVSVVATAAAPVLLRWWCAPTVIAGGAVVAVLGAVAVVLVAAAPGAPLPWLLLAASAVALGMAPVFALATVLVLNHAPAEATGSAQASQDVSGSLGNTVGIAVGGSVAVLTYSGGVASGAPAGLPPDVAERSTQSVGAALEAAAATPGRLGADLADAAIAALSGATAAAYLVAAVGFAAVAAVGLWLRRLVADAPTGQADPPDAAAARSTPRHTAPR